MLGIAALQLFPDFVISPFPETVEVRRQLDRLVARGKQFHQDGTAAVVHPGRVHEPEAFLQPYAHDGGVGSLPVLHADTAAGRDGDMGRRQPFHRLPLRPVQQRPKGLAQVDALEFSDRRRLPEERRKPLRGPVQDGFRRQVREFQLRMPGGDGGHAPL